MEMKANQEQVELTGSQGGELVGPSAGLDAGEGPGVLRLDSYGPECVIFESGLAAMLGRCPTSLRRAWQERGELPTPCRAFGQYYWTCKALAEHFQKRVDAAARDREKLAAKVAKLTPG